MEEKDKQEARNNEGGRDKWIEASIYLIYIRLVINVYEKK